ncbi:MAG: hypothetical protein Q9P01_06080 [Anaerolineae bacterium]|nr:hypothetical protein [Anaerolineae bacterium]
MMAWDCKPLFMPRQVLSITKNGQFLGNHLGFRPQLSPYAVHQLADTFTLDMSKTVQLLDYPATLHTS